MLSRTRARVDLTAARDAIAAVEDPEIHRGLGELGMLREVDERRGTLHVQVALTTSDSPLRESLHDAIVSAARSVDGVNDIRVSFAAMTERERMELAEKLRAEAPTKFGGNTLDDSPSVYAVASGKGGVGKSTVAANLAVALAASGQRVGLLDADVWGYSVPHLFGVRRPPVALKGLMLPIEAHGVRLMSVGFFVSDEQPVVWRGPMLHKALEQFLSDVYWGELDTLILDLPPGTGDITLSLLELVPQVSIVPVTTPQPAARNVAARVGKMARDMRVPVAGVVENMSELRCQACAESTPLFGSGGGQWLAEQLDTTLLAQIPLDVPLRDADDSGVPVVLDAPRAPSATALRQLAEQLPVTRRSLSGIPLPLSVV